jgi:hypothetical protein
MASTAPHLERFLLAVHRRLVVVRVVEHAGLGALAGCAGTTLILPLLLWRGEPTVMPVGALMALGVVAGMGWGVARRPSRLSAAMEADRQLDLHDLLGTAAGAGPDDGSNPWFRTVLALADEQCRRHTPAQVVLRRYGSRAWGGIGLAASLVLTLAALLSPPGTTPAIASRDPGAAVDRSAANPDHSAELPAPAATPRNVVGVPLHESRSLDTDPSTDDELPRRDEARALSGDPSNSTPRSTAASGTDGKGGGAGRARPRVASPDAPSSSPPNRGAAPSGDARANATATGGGSEVPDSSPGNGDGPGAASGTTIAPSGRVAPWESSSWRADARAAEGALETGRVPDSYRDLVRQFFDR